MIDEKIKTMMEKSFTNDLQKLLKTHSVAPTHAPKKFMEQIYLYKNSTTYRLYVYLNSEWKYVNLS